MADPTAEGNLSFDGADDHRSRREVAASPATAVDRLRNLAGDPHTGVRSAAAANPQCPKELLLELATDRSEWVRAAVAANPSAPDTALADLAVDPAWNVRATSAARVADPALLDRLARDSDVDVRRAVAGNANVHPTAIEVLCEDSDQLVIGALTMNPGVGGDVLRRVIPRLTPAQRAELATRDDLEVAIVADLAHDPEPTVREAIAHRRTVEPAVLLKLASDPEQSVRTAVHRHDDATDEAKALASLLGVQQEVRLRD